MAVSINDPSTAQAVWDQLTPAAGIPASDLAASVQTSLGKADAALQPGALPAGTTLPAAQINDATAAGRAVLTAADQAAQRTAMGAMAATLAGWQSAFDAAPAAEKAVAQASVSGYVQREIPAGLGWDSTSYPIQIFTADPGDGYVTGWHPKQSAAYAACLAGPAYYVSPTGSDSTGTGAQATPYRTIWKAQQAANAGGVPARIIVAAGTYNKDQNFTVGISANQPTVDTLYIASGVVTVTTHAAVTFAADATYANTSSASRTSVARVFDLRERDRRTGLYREFTKVADATVCNRSAWTWAQVGSTLYVNRGDGVLAADSNTRVLLSVTNAVAQTAVSLFYCAEDSRSQWALEGGAAGCMVHSYSATTGQRILYAESMSARYAGTAGDTSLANGFAPNSVRGIAWFEDCSGDGNKSDGFNWHDGNGVGSCHFVTVRCSANGAGVYAATSCNGWTSHENCVAIDVGGTYQMGAGGTVHTINTTKTFCAGTLARWSIGDRHFGGAFVPAEFRVSDAAEVWLDGCGAEVLTRGEGYHLFASDTGKIHTRSMRQSGMHIARAVGATIDTY